MKEIEVKAKVDNVREIRTRLENLGCVFSVPKRQEDVVFLARDVEYENIRTGTNVLRVRKTGDTCLFTLKRRGANELDNIEKEVTVSDGKTITDMLGLLGYRAVVAVNKERVECRYGEYEICLDTVDTLGEFIEIEKMSDEDGETVQQELLAFLLTLGVNPSDRVTKGYDTLVRERIRQSFSKENLT
jgi:adenylate cyclase class 2